MNKELVVWKLKPRRKDKNMEGLKVTVSFKVEGKETYENVSTWENLPPVKVIAMEKIMMKGQEEFIKQASKF